MTINTYPLVKLKYPNTGKTVSTILAGLAVLLCLALTCTTVFAEAFTWEEYAKEVRKLEEEMGFYADWPIAPKEALIQTLIDMGYIKTSDTTTQLFDASVSETDKHVLADQTMMEFLGGDDNALVHKDGVRAVRWESITRAILGNSPSEWTQAQRVWFQEVTNMFGRQDPDTLVLPSDDDLPVEEVISIAQKAIFNAYGIEQGVLDPSDAVVDLYITKDYPFQNNRPDYRRWNVSWTFYQPTLKGYIVIIDENGHVIADTDVGWKHVQEMALQDRTMLVDTTPLIVKTFQAYAEEADTYFPWQWPFEVKADYSKQIRPLVLAAVKNNDLSALTNVPYCDEPIQEIINSSTFAYGLPEKKHVQEEKALQIAIQTLMDENKLARRTIEGFDVYTSFDVTNADTPLWKFVFCPDSFEDMQTVLLYKIELDANTHDVTSNRSIDWDQLFQDSAYDMILY